MHSALFGMTRIHNAPQHPVTQLDQLILSCHLELGDGVTDDLHRMHEAKVVRVCVGAQAGLVHRVVNYGVGNQ